MTFRSLRAALFALVPVILSCGREPTAPIAPEVVRFDGAMANLGSSSIVISQAYPGGNNSGATYNRKYIELFNRGTTTVSLAGWSIQWASATGTGLFSGNTQTNLSGSVAPGQYFLVQIGPISGGSGAALPVTPDLIGATGTTPAAASGKIIIANTTTGLACNGSAGQPCNAAQLAQIVDLIGYGTSNFFEDGSAAPTLSATLAGHRAGAGCTDTDANGADFSAAAPAPRNSLTALNPCNAPPVPIVTVSPATASITSGATPANTKQFSAIETLAGVEQSTTFAWSSDNAAVATVDASTGLASAVAPGTANIKATATDGKFGTAVLTVSSPVIASVTVSPVSGTGEAGSGQQQQYTAVAKDAANNTISTTFTWSTSDANIASVNASGLATAGSTTGTATIKATAPNGVFGSATFVTTPSYVSHAGELVVSQIYGGGGNSGGAFRNDFIEIFNRGTSPVNVDGWSVQRTSAAGTGWDGVATLSGTIQPGRYYLIQEAAGTDPTQPTQTPLPTPDAIANGAMGAGSGKVLIAQTTTPFTGVACPSGNVVVDLVVYGSSGNACGATAPGPSNNATAALRLQFGCKYTPNAATDFATGAPTPRNSASPARSCVAGPLDHVTVTTPISVFVGATSQLVPETFDVNGLPVTGATFTYTTDDAAVATVSASGLVTGVSSSGSPATITVTATAGGVSKSADVEVGVINPGGINWIEIVFVRSSSMPPGFQTEMAVRARESSGGTIIPATFTYEAVDAANISAIPIPGNNASALLTALAAPGDGSKPRVKITATPTGGGTAYSVTLRPVTVEVPNPASPSIYGFNDAFGRPSAAGSSANDFLIQRDQYVLSYNQSRGTPNWVAYELDSRHMVPGADRCNCFAVDPLLPNAAKIYLYDYTNGGYDRGHMARSADRTAGNVDNAITFYMTNMVPQFNELNSGPWAQFENMLGDSARLGGRAVHIVTGPLYTTPLQFVNNAGKVAIPDFTWKVALIGPRNGGIPFDHVSDWNDIPGLTVLAVKMPNVTSVVLNPLTYLTTVETLEQETGYDLFSLLQQGMQNAIQYKDHAPTAAFSKSGTQNEGSVITFDASASADADVGRTDLGGRTEGLTYSWTFGDGGVATGKVVTHTFADNGNYSVQLTVTDVFGWPVSTTTSVAIANVAPTATLAAPGNVNEGSAIALALNASNDAGSIDVESGFTYAFDCGTGSGYGAATPASTASCATTQPGSRTVRGKVIDKDGDATEYSAYVTIDNVAPAIAAYAAASIFRTETYSTNGSFTDPGANTWSATVDYGDGGGVTTLSLVDKTFALSHTYATAGTFTVTVSVSDGYVTSTRTQTVTVLSSIAALGELTAQINAFQADGVLSSGNANSLKSKVEAAVKSLEKGNNTPALNQLQALVNEINAEENAGRLSAADAATLRTLVNRVIASVTG